MTHTTCFLLGLTMAPGCWGSTPSDDVDTAADAGTDGDVEGDSDTDTETETDVQTDTESGVAPWESLDCEAAHGESDCGTVQRCASDCKWEHTCVQTCLDAAKPASCDLALAMQRRMVCVVEECGDVCSTASDECHACVADCPPYSEADLHACWNERGSSH